MAAKWGVERERERERTKSKGVGGFAVLLVIGITVGSIGFVVPGAVGSGGGQVYYPPYTGPNANPTFFPTPTITYGGPQCSLTPSACGAEFQPGPTNLSLKSETPNSATGQIFNTQNATVGEWVHMTPNGNGVGPYYSSGQVRENLSISVNLTAGVYNISESWQLQGETALLVWGVSNIGGNLTASYAMFLGLEIVSTPGRGLIFIQQLPYSSAQLGCATPCNLTSYHSLSGSAQPTFRVALPASGNYTVIPFLLWNSTARETGVGDATALSCLNMGSASWCPLPSWDPQLAGGWGLLQSLTIA